MSFLDELFNKLFPARQLNQPVQVQEELRRSTGYQQDYKAWKNSREATDLIREVERSYYLKSSGIEGNYPVHLFRSAAANGFALTYHPQLAPQVFHFLLDYWRDRMLSIDYRLANTDRQIQEKEGYIQTTEKHYLKPPLSRGQSKAEQHYGNVLLEYVLIDNQPSYLKLMVTIYTDHLFTEAKPYEELVQHLFVTA